MSHSCHWAGIEHVIGDALEKFVALTINLLDPITVSTMIIILALIFWNCVNYDNNLSINFLKLGLSLTNQIKGVCWGTMAVNVCCIAIIIIFISIVQIQQISFQMHFTILEEIKSTLPRSLFLQSLFTNQIKSNVGFWWEGKTGVPGGKPLIAE